MRQYGAKKATEFTNKQIGVIFGMAKRNELQVEKWVMREFYNLAEYYGYDDNRSVEASERKIMNILTAVFANELEEAQNLINEYTEKEFTLLSNKNQKACDRTYVA